MATVDELRILLNWGALSAHDQWAAPTRWDTGGSRPTDGEIVRRVAAGEEIGARYLRRFAREYGIGRFKQIFEGPGGEEIDRRDEIAAAVSAGLERVYRPALEAHGAAAAPPPGSVLAGLWWEAIEAVRPATGQRSRSLCKKTMWLYMPATVTMWDALAADAVSSLGADLRLSAADLRLLARVPSGRRRVADFLDAFVRAFEALHAAVEAEARASAEAVAAALGADAYPYTRRVVDKALWMLGAAASDPARPGREIRHAARRYPDCAGLLAPAAAAHP